MGAVYENGHAMGDMSNASIPVSGSDRLLYDGYFDAYLVIGDYYSSSTYYIDMHVILNDGTEIDCNSKTLNSSTPLFTISRSFSYITFSCTKISSDIRSISSSIPNILITDTSNRTLTITVTTNDVYSTSGSTSTYYYSKTGSMIRLSDNKIYILRGTALSSSANFDFGHGYGANYRFQVTYYVYA